MLRSVSTPSDHAASQQSVSELMGEFFLGGFECSCHRIAKQGRRLDLQESTGHLQFAQADFAAVRQQGMSTCRDGVSWVRSEPRAGYFDFSAAAELLAAARANGVRL